MKKLTLVLIFSLVACAKDESKSPTPIADQFIANQENYIEENCGGMYTFACENAYFHDLYNALGTYYNITDELVVKHCILSGACEDEREAEYFFMYYDGHI